MPSDTPFDPTISVKSLADAPITGRKLLSKLEFVFRGSAASVETNALKDALYAFAKESSEKHVSRQSIMYWFSKNSAPSRANAYAFLRDFVETRIVYEDLSGSQKMVYKQILSFLRNLTSKKSGKLADISHNEKVYYVSGGNTAIRVSRHLSEFSLISRSLEGTYLLYRTRLSESERRPIVQELVRIRSRPPELRFEHWYLRDGRHKDSFTGAIVLIGDLLWFIGASKMAPDRFRVMSFRKNRGYPEDTRAILWGIMLSDGCSVAADEPGACRVLLKQISDAPNPITELYLNQKLAFLNQDDQALPNARLIWRLINNKYTASSQHENTEPVTKRDGSEVLDSILKVDQITLSKATTELQNE